MGDTAVPGLIRLGKILGTHGLRGDIRIHAFSEDPDIFSELPLVQLDNGAEYKIAAARAHKKQAIVKLAGVETIEAAEKIVGQEVWGKRELFPEPEDDSFYWVDLVGCEVVDGQGESIGIVKSLDSLSGAHDNLVVRRDGGREAMIPFVDEMIREVDLKARRILVELPEGLLDLDLAKGSDEA
jgi:16S rRNA processing protein RimM